jgi:SAM-dependent methyltransferase
VLLPGRERELHGWVFWVPWLQAGNKLGAVRQHEGRLAADPPAARYDEWADWYENYITGEAQPVIWRTAKILTQILGQGSGPVLELACGTGIHAQLLSGPGWTPLGLDILLAQLRYARSRMPVVAADAGAPPISPGTLAAVAAVMCHTDIDDYAATCQALSPALRSGGVFVHVGVHPCYVCAFADRANPSKIIISRATGRRHGAMKPGRDAESGPRSAPLTFLSVS